MATLTEISTLVTVGVDTHKDFHVAVVLDTAGRLLGSEQFPANVAGYRKLLGWAGLFGTIEQIGIEGTGSWGAGLARYAGSRGLDCVEVTRPNRQHRRRYGKSDHADAHGAAKAVQSGEATGRPRGRDGAIEGLRSNRVARRSAIKSRTQAIHQLRSLVVTAPEELRDRLCDLSNMKMVATAARFRTTTSIDTVNTTKHAMRALARRITYLNEEIAELEQVRARLVKHAAPPAMLKQHGIGPSTATDLLITYGSNPDRIHSDAAFAALCGV